MHWLHIGAIVCRLIGAVRVPLCVDSLGPIWGPEGLEKQQQQQHQQQKQKPHQPQQQPHNHNPQSEPSHKPYQKS